MRFSWIDIDGYRRLVGVRTEFSDRFTVVAGDNEAGKSSLHDALVRALYGFTKSERRRSDGQSVLDRRAPWRPGPNGYGLRLHVVDAEIRGAPVDQLEIAWRYADHKVTVRHPETGEDFTAAVSGKNQDVTLGEALLGLDINDFLGVCALQQTDLSAVPRTEGLMEALQNAVAKRGGGSVDRAKARLTKAGGELGLRANTLSTNPRGKLDNLTTRRGELTDGLAAAREAREALDDLASDVANARHALAEAQRAEDETAATLKRSTLAELRARADRARTLESAATCDLEPVVLDEEAMSLLRRSLDAHDAEAAEVKGLEHSLRASEDRVKELRQTEATLAVEIQALTPYQSVDPSRLTEVLAIWTELDAAPTTPSPAPPPSDEQRPNVALLIAATAIAVLAVVAAVAVTPLAAAGLAVSAGLAWLGRGRRRTSAPRVPPEPVQPTIKVIDRLVAALDAVGAPPAASPAERAQAYVGACGRHTELLEARVKAGALDREIQTLLAATPEHERRAANLARLDETIRVGRERLSITATEPAAIRATLDELEQHRGSVANARASAESARKQLEALLAGTTVPDLEERVAELEQDLEAHGQLNGSVGDSVSLGIESARAATRSRDTEVRLAQLSTELATREEEVPDAAEIEVELALVCEQIEWIERRRDALRLALDTLTVAATETYRVYAPPLNAALAAHLPRITAGRYIDGIVRDDLSILVTAPETGERVSASELSRGTQDQIFLAQRLAIAQLLDDTGGAVPLLLDDPFAHYDATRLALAIELLAEAAETRQVVLFTEDERAIELAEAAGAHVARLEVAAVVV